MTINSSTKYLYHLTAHQWCMKFSVCPSSFLSFGIMDLVSLSHSNEMTGFPCGSAGKESACNVRDLGLIPGLRRSPGEGKGYPLQYSGLEKSMDCIVHGVAKSGT